MRGAATEEATAAAEPAGPLESTERCGQAACDDSHFSIERNLRFDRSELLHLNSGQRRLNLNYIIIIDMMNIEQRFLLFS